MTVKDLDGNIQAWHLTGHIAKGRLVNKSSFHLRARQLLVKEFPTLQILEEVPISIRRSETLYLDFYLPLKKTCIEIHGEQHYKFIPFYHNNILGFIKSQKRDRDKTEWCSINGINQIIFPYNKNIAEWRTILYDSKNI